MNGSILCFGMYSHILFGLVSTCIYFLYISFSVFFSFQLSIMKDEPEEAELILHDALRLAYQNDNKKAIIYTYDLVTHVTNLSHTDEGWVQEKGC